MDCLRGPKGGLPPWPRGLPPGWRGIGHPHIRSAAGAFMHGRHRRAEGRDGTAVVGPEGCAEGGTKGGTAVNGAPGNGGGARPDPTGRDQGRSSAPSGSVSQLKCGSSGGKDLGAVRVKTPYHMALWREFVSGVLAAMSGAGAVPLGSNPPPPPPPRPWRASHAGRREGLRGGWTRGRA